MWETEITTVKPQIDFVGDYATVILISSTHLAMAGWVVPGRGGGGGGEEEVEG